MVLKQKLFRVEKGGPAVHHDQGAIPNCSQTFANIRGKKDEATLTFDLSYAVHFYLASFLNQKKRSMDKGTLIGEGAAQPADCLRPQAA